MKKKMSSWRVGYLLGESQFHKKEVSREEKRKKMMKKKEEEEAKL